MYLEPPAGDENAFLLGLRAEAAGLGHFSLWSHVAFVPGILAMYRFRLHSANVFFIFANVMSLAYHACGVTDHCLGLTFEQARAADHLTAALITVALSEILEGLHERRAVRGIPLFPRSCWRRRGRGAAEQEAEDDADAPVVSRDLLVYTGIKLPVIIIGVAVASLTNHRFDIYPVYVALVLCLIFALVRVMLFRVELRLPAPDYLVTSPLAVSLPWLLAGLLLAGCGILLFGLDAGGSLTHSFWHILIALAVFCFAVGVSVPPGHSVTLGEAHRRVLAGAL